MEQQQADQYNQQLIGKLLRVGVLISMGVVALGGIIYLWFRHHALADYSVFKPTADFESIVLVFSGLSSFSPSTFIQVGIILLIFTPIARVLLATISFWFEKDYLYVAIGLIILTIISLSLAGGFTH